MARTNETTEMEWVQRNRRRNDRTKSLHDAVRDVLDRASRGRRDDHRALVERAIDAVVDDRFRADCTVGRLRSGVLEINVRDRRLLFEYRVQWALDVLEAVRRQCRSLNIRQVKFLDVEGASKPPAGESA